MPAINNNELYSSVEAFSDTNNVALEFRTGGSTSATIVSLPLCGATRPQQWSVFLSGPGGGTIS